MLNNYYPSKIINQVYDLMDEHAWGLDKYFRSLVDALINFFDKELPDVQWTYECSNFPDDEDGVCAFCWVEDGHPQMVLFGYTYSDWEVL